MNLTRLPMMVSISMLFHVGLAIADPIADGNIPVDVCDSLRLAGKCKPSPLSTESNMREQKIRGRKMEIKRKIALPAQPMPVGIDACEAHFDISYAQMNDKVKVETSVRNDTCAASHGDFSLRIRTLAQTGKTLTRSFSESWSRPDKEGVLLTKYYPMGSSRDLIWVRVNSNRKTACACD